MSRYRRSPLIRLTPAAVLAAATVAALLLAAGSRSKGSKNTSDSSGSSDYIRCPVCGYTLETSLTSGYGRRADPLESGGTEQHDGLDLAAPEGTPVMAAQDGVVSSVQHSDTGYGNMVVIDHGNGRTTLYAHCARLFVGEGERVVRGQIIASVGSTGNSTGPHLHFEMRLGGVPQNIP